MTLILALLIQTGSVTLAWDPVTDQRLAGYKVHYGTSSRVYDQTIDAGNVMQFTVPNLVRETVYYFAVSAYGTGGEVSSYSNEVTAVPGSGLFPPTLTITGVLSQFAQIKVDFRKPHRGITADFKRAASGPAKLYRRVTK